MVVLCCIVVVTGFLPFPVSRSSLSSPPSQVLIYLHIFIVFSSTRSLLFWNTIQLIFSQLWKATETREISEEKTWYIWETKRELPGIDIT